MNENAVNAGLSSMINAGSMKIHFDMLNENADLRLHRVLKNSDELKSMALLYSININQQL